ncbi:MAG TPA: tetratricopeptide repeat protein [Opitutaceae bacterium]|nr:tetratricopeptide repeat protein [Opitutaceae bacterium]
MPPPPRLMVLLAAAVIALAAVAAYSNTFSVPLLFDDLPSITYNPTLLSLREALLHPPAGYGVTVSGRPLLNFTLAVNYALSGTDVWSYHALNLLIHVLAGLTLFGIVRRTIILLRGREQGARGKDATAPASSPPSSLPPAPSPLPRRDDANFVAFAVALLWTLHPLQTEAVTYIIQRTESLMGLFYLLTLYCFIRGVEGTTRPPTTDQTDADQAGSVVRGPWSGGPESSRPLFWYALSILCCVLGMATKEVMVTAPVLVLLYDRTFVAGSFRAAWGRRRWVHLALVATWLPLGWLVATTGGDRGGTSGFSAEVAPWAYWLTQFKAVATYLKLSVWPHPLVFEYGTFWTPLLEALAYALAVVPLAAATLVAVRRWPVGGFLGAWFFAILAPTSLVPGTIQMIVEHRMYLPLVAVIALVVGVGVSWFGRTALVVFLAAAAIAGVATRQRNATYRDDLALWQETVDRAPGSAIAQSNLGAALFARDRLREALHHYEVSYRLNPNLASIHFNLGLVLVRTQRLSEAAAHFAEAFRLNPRFYPAHHQLGLTLLRLGRPEEALAQFAQAIQLAPAMTEAHYEAGVALMKLGRAADAIPRFRDALRLNPDYVEAACDLGVALYQSNRTSEAVECLQQVLRTHPQIADAHFNLGLALAQLGRAEEAAAQYAEAVRIDPKHPSAQLNLGIALAQAGRLPEALAHLEQAVQLGPDSPDAHCNLGIALAEAGRLDEAVSHYRTALQLRPDYAGAHYNLGNALLELRRVAEARAHFEEALRIDPRFDPAREVLRRLPAAESVGAVP